MIRRINDPDGAAYDTRVVEGPDYEVINIPTSFAPGTILLINALGETVGGISEEELEANWEEVDV